VAWAGGGGAGAASPPLVWVDAQLPPALAQWLSAERGVDARHVLDAGLLGAADCAIFDAARAAGVAAVLRRC
jgi:predicted nuclease of predicted toxin-antitoxin system